MQNLLYYMRSSKIGDSMLWKKAAIDQMIFIRDTICYRLLESIKPFVISSHMSKSISLPVYGFQMHNGITVICRDNFYDWNVTIKLPEEIGKKNAIPADLIDGPGYCQGFDKSWIYKAYDPEDISLKNFTVSVDNDWQFYTLMYFLKHLFPTKTYEDDKMYTKEEIVDKLKKINKEQGNSDLYDCQKQYGLSHSKMKPVMSAWELWWNTYNHFDNKVKFIPDPNRKGYIIRDINFDMDTPEDAEKFAEFIINDSEGMKIFKSELHEYEQTF